MKRPQPSRTTGPLHFEDLEPHRFEDLVRRLIYDFRPWRELQATGRSGSDDGFDARGIVAGPEVPVREAEDSAEEDAIDPMGSDRIWLIQCKREKTIGPKKLVGYVEEIPAQEAGQLHGIVFAAACDFSKVARDAFREKARSTGLAEAYLWGRGELEDMIYQPKNDDILFTFFGVSLGIRRRSLTTQIRRRLAIKRKVKRILGEGMLTEVLVRDASDERYPYAGDDEGNTKDLRRWCVYRVHGCNHDGIHVLVGRHFAYIGDDGVSWDFAETMNDASPHENPWRTEEDERKRQKRSEAREREAQIWNALPQQNKAWFELYHVLPYDGIIDVDEHGDEYFEHPHVYVDPFVATLGPFLDRVPYSLQSMGAWDGRRATADESKRVQKFGREEQVDEENEPPVAEAAGEPTAQD